jgi:hypothetical protein
MSSAGLSGRGRLTLDLARQNIGRRVLYTPPQRLGRPVEPGVITSVNDTFVFVLYQGSKHSAATRPEDLEFE